MADQGSTTGDAGAQGAGDAGKTALEAVGAGAAADTSAAGAGGASGAGVSDAKGGADAGKKSDGESGADEKSLLEGANEDAPAKTLEQEAKEKADADKAKSDADAASKLTEPTYAKELKRPDGVEWNDGAWKSVAPVLAQHGIPKEAAQALIDSFSSYQSAQQAAVMKEVQQQRQTSRAECLRLFKKEDFQSARRYLDRECKDDVLRNVLMQQLGDHPAFISMMAKAGRAIADDSSPGAAGSGGGTSAVSRADKFYGKQP